MAVALIVAAGRGERLGADLPKALVPLAGRPLLQWSVDVIARVPAIDQIVVALPIGMSELPAKVELPSGAGCGAAWVEGGEARSQSVKRALAVAGPGDPVLVHDAARPLLSAALIESTLAAVGGDGVDAAIAAAPVTDTIKRVDVGLSSNDDSGLTGQTRDGGGPMIVRETLDRRGLWAVQTPQVFRRATLEQALDAPDEVLAQATDDAWLVERAGGRVAIVASDRENIKVTSPIDLALAELLLARRA